MALIYSKPSTNFIGTPIATSRAWRAGGKDIVRNQWVLDLETNLGLNALVLLIALILLIVGGPPRSVFGC